jgi:phosphoribosyl 1,2-cyclic phosphate phosphodiesterase
MVFQFLGTAAATSVPLVFCNCEVCRRARINKGRDIRKRASAIINHEMLIDLGPDLCSQAQMYDVDLSKTKYLLQTHSHSDHFDGGHFITRCSQYATKNLTHLDIICSNGTCSDMNHWIKENDPSFDIYDNSWQKDMNYELHLVKSGDIKVFNDYEIIAVDSEHDKRVEALVYIIGYKGKYVFYGTDLPKLSSKAWNIIQNYKLDLVVLDQTYGKGYNQGGHLDSEQVIEIINEMRARKIINDNTYVYATHISHEGNDTHDNMEFQSIVHKYHIAYDGLEIEL